MVPISRPLRPFLRPTKCPGIFLSQFPLNLGFFWQINPFSAPFRVSSDMGQRSVVFFLFMTCLDIIQAYHFKFQSLHGISSGLASRVNTEMETAGSVMLTNKGDVSYYADIMVGNQTFTVLVDTGRCELSSQRQQFDSYLLCWLAVRICGSQVRSRTVCPLVRMQVSNTLLIRSRVRGYF